MKNMKKIFFYSLIFTTIIFFVSLIPFSKQTVVYYNQNSNGVTISNFKQISAIFDLKNKNIDSYTIFLDYSNLKKNFETNFHYDIEKLSNYNRPKFPSPNYEQIGPKIFIELVSDNIKYTKAVFTSELVNGINSICIKTPKFKNMHYKSITMTIRTENLTLEEQVSVLVNESKQYGAKFLINDKEIKKTELSAIVVTHSSSITFLNIFIAIMFIIFYFKTRNYDLNKIKFINYILIISILSILIAISSLKFNVLFSSYEIISRKYLLLFLLASFLFEKLFVDFLKNNIHNIEKIFVIMSIFIGTLYVFTIVPNGTPDENHHYYETEKLSKLNFDNNPEYKIFKKFDSCGKSYRKYQCIEETFYQIKDNDKKYIAHSTASQYNDILYLPAATGLAISRTIGLNFATTYYIGRLFNLFITILFGYYSIKLLDKGKLILLVYLLNSMFFHQGMSYSADVLTNAVSILFISLSLRKNKYSPKDLILLLALLPLFLIIKRPYIFLFVLLLSRIDIDKKIDKNVVKKGLLILLVLNIGYFIFTNINYTNNFKTSLFNIVRNPVDFIELLINTLKVNGTNYFETMFGSKLGWLEIEINHIYIYAYILLLLFTTLVDKVSLNKKQIIMCVVSLILSIMAIFTGFLIIYPVRSEIVIFGVQGRYFIPIAILLFYIINSKLTINIKINKNKYTYYICIILLILNLLILKQVANYYM